jgi:hypothetical protein
MAGEAGREPRGGLRPALVGVLSSVLFLLGAIAGLPGVSAPVTGLSAATVQATAAVDDAVPSSGTTPTLSVAASRAASLAGERRTASSTQLTQQRPSPGGAAGVGLLFADLAVPSWTGLVRPPVQAVTSTSVFLAGGAPSSHPSRAPPGQAVRV